MSFLSTIDEFEIWRKTGRLQSGVDLVQFMNRHTEELRSVDVDDKYESDDRIRIVLNVMMKNEHTVMSRCITSALQIIDAVCYSDTGSDAAVFEILRNTVPDNLPLCVEIEPWQNFGYNRTKGQEQTRRFVQRMKWNPDKTYVLCIDADMTLTVLPTFSKDLLTHGCYTIEQKNGSLVYWNSRLLRVSNHWFVVGRTHEYYDSKIYTKPESLSTLKINDISDGANRTNKFDRDIILLMEDLIDNPKNARAMFYLAESYRNRGKKENNDFEKAIHNYKKHIETGSWPEEMWFSKFMIGMCYEILDKEEEMLKAYLDAYENRPHRAEPMFRLGHFYRIRSKDHVALMFFKFAEKIPFPAQDILFVDKEVYDCNILFQMSLSSYFVKDVESGNYCIQKLLRSKNTSSYVRNLTNHNARFFIKPFPNADFASIGPTTITKPYRPCNPSITMYNNKLVINCRLVNYSQYQARGHKVLEETGIFNTENTIMIIEAKDINKMDTYTLERELQIHSKACGPFYHTCMNRGLEDARLLNIDNKIVLSCTSLEFRSDNDPRMVWVELIEKENTFLTTKTTLITGYEDNKTQKNWLPFVWNNNEIYFVYNYSPFTLLKLDTETSTVHPYLQIDLPVNAEHWRGSSGPVLIENQGWLILVHEVCDRKEDRYYMHRFVLMNEKFTELRAVSDLFYFKHKSGVEMATGMVYIDGHILITLGIEDCQAFLIKTTWENVNAFIQNSAK
jgi:predicted GH43/DUF377 family glycosyl hydrolase